MIHWLIQQHTPADNDLSPTFLSQAETAQLATLKTDKRRQDWLLGRWTAKNLLQTVVTPQPPLQTIEILSATDGAPTLTINGHPRDDLSLTISHSHNHAFCAAICDDQQGYRLGADIEHIQPRVPTFADDYFTPSELAFVNQFADQTDYAVGVTAIWSAKEAALKALRLGLTVSTHAVAIQPTDLPHAEWMPFSVYCHPDRLPFGAEPFTLMGWWRRYQAFVLTLVSYQEIFA